MEENEYILHVEFDEIEAELDKLDHVDSKKLGSIKSFVSTLQETAFRVEPILRKETYDEKELWGLYKTLTREKLAVLDLSHEWDYLEQDVKEINPRIDLLVRDAIEELKDHIYILAESHRAHIDILEIYNTRKIEFLALVITAVISYIAVWEFFVRDLIAGINFPSHLSPALNYVLVLLTLIPVFTIVGWAWTRRKSYF
ncbi:MAG TPA: hypothetical protein VK253_04490 [Candidatus Binatia bacterium]|nr:hypothetical protein [Candidatus Binatia bacterium]